MLDKAKRLRSSVWRYNKWSDISADLRKFSNEILDAILGDLENANKQQKQN
jgi:hypothetical protein